MAILLGIIAALGAALAFVWGKKQNAEALNQNIEVKNQVNQIDVGIAKDQGLLDAEAAKRQQIQQDIDKAKAQQDNVNELIDFINKKNK